jgi:hypothetical protein
MKSRALTLDVLINEEHHYFDLEAFVLQQILLRDVNTKGTEESIVTLYQNYEDGTHTIISDSSVSAQTSLETLKKIDGDIGYIIDGNRLYEDIVLWDKGAATAQTKVDIIPAVEYKTASSGTTIKSRTITFKDIASSEKESCDEIISFLHARMRYKIAKLSDEQYNKLISAWKWCIANTFELYDNTNGCPIVCSNEPITE